MIALHEVQKMIDRLEEIQEDYSQKRKDGSRAIDAVIELAELITNMQASKVDLHAFIESLEAEVIE